MRENVTYKLHSERKGTILWEYLVDENREFSPARTCPFKVVPWLSILADLLPWSSELRGLSEVVSQFSSKLPAMIFAS